MQNVGHNIYFPLDMYVNQTTVTLYPCMFIPHVNENRCKYTLPVHMPRYLYNIQKNIINEYLCYLPSKYEMKSQGTKIPLSVTDLQSVT